MILMFMMGGFSQIDLFDLKLEFVRWYGQIFLDNVKFDNLVQVSCEIMKFIWRFRQYGECGMEFLELLLYFGEIVDDIILVCLMYIGVNNYVLFQYVMNIGDDKLG